MKRLGRVVAASLWGLAAGILGAAVIAIGIPVGISEPTAVLPVAVVVTTIVTAVKLLRDRLRSIASRAEQRAERRGVALERAVAEIAAISAFSATGTRYPLPLGGKWALAWDGAVILAREVALAKPEWVVELGAGASSLVIGIQLRHADRGRVLSLEHDPRYAAITRSHVAALGLEPWVRVLDAPLEEVEVDGRTWRWYHLPPEVKELERIDMLVVDGPPHWVDREGEPRYPALPILASRMTPGAVVFLDDADRAAEHRMIERWLLQHPEWVLESLKTSRGTALLRLPATSDAAEGAAPPTGATTRSDSARA